MSFETSFPHSMMAVRAKNGRRAEVQIVGSHSRPVDVFQKGVSTTCSCASTLPTTSLLILTSGTHGFGAFLLDSSFSFSFSSLKTGHTGSDDFF